VHAASVAEFKAFILTKIGSQIKFLYVSHIPVLEFTSTPKNLPLPSYKLCYYLSLFNTITESRPALSAIVLGITSRALAKALIIYYSLPELSLALCLKYLDISNSTAPPPATISVVFIALLTIMIESLRDLSASLINYSAPPLRIIVAECALVQLLNKLYLSAPN
jgi:hypothetical protein